MQLIERRAANCTEGFLSEKICSTLFKFDFPTGSAGDSTLLVSDWLIDSDRQMVSSNHLRSVIFFLTGPALFQTFPDGSV